MPQDLNNMTDDSLDSIKSSTRPMVSAGRKAGRLVNKATRGLRKKAKEAIKRAAKEAAKRVAQAVKALGQLIAKLFAAFPVAMAIILVVIILICLAYMWFYEERGSTQSKTLDPEYDNPTYVDDTVGILRADKLTEPQAVLDAYYKYLSCQSYTKEYGYEESGIWKTKGLTFREDTEDFAGLSDYYGAEGDYYLSPELIMMADEILHKEEFRWPEHIIAPVNHKLVDYVDSEGNHRKIVETQPLRGADDMVDKTLVQKTGLGSVLQYEPGKKDDYVSAKITSFQVDYDLVIPPSEDHPETTYQHLETKTFTVSETDTIQKLRDKVDNHLHSLNEDYLLSDSYVVCSGPSDTELGQFIGKMNIERTANGVTTSFTIDHMPQEVLGKDMEVDKTAFNDSTLNSAFGNDANGLYPIKIPLVSSAATFSGNIRYTYISEPIGVALQDGSSEHLYDPVDKYVYQVRCLTRGNVDAIAAKTGRHITVCPVVSSKNPDPRNLEYTREDRDVENGNPWDYQYFDDYVRNYSAKVPTVVLDDGDFYKRATDKETLDMLKELGLLSEATEALNAAGTYTDEELEIVARLIKHEAGSNKLDELMVGAVFVNRMAHPAFPNTAQEVLMQPGQYGVGSDGTPHVLWENIIPSESNWDSARRVLSGEFSIPSNVVFQAAFTQGQGTYMVNVNSATGGAYENTHYYCWYGSSLSNVDRFGRTALSSEGAIALAKDIEEGGAGAAPEDEKPDVGSVYYGEKLYASVGFNTVTATNMLHKIAKPKTGFLGLFAGLFETPEDFFSSLHGRVFAANFDLNAAESVRYDYTPSDVDQRRIIYQAVTFRDGERYTDVMVDWEAREDTFLFIGDKMDDSEISIISYVGSILPGWVSPTVIPSTPTSTTAGASGKGAIMSTLEGELLQALYDGRVTGVTDSTVTITYDVTNGVVYSSTYHGLSEVLVTNGTQVKTGDSVGKAGSYEGSPGFMFEFYCVSTGSYEAPMNYFYQVIYSGGSSDVVAVALAEAAAFKANPSAFDKLKYERWRQGSATGEAWCADFVSWCGWQVYPNSQWPRTAGAGTMKQIAEQKGVFEPSMAYGGSYTPQPGDVIFYVWDNSGAQVCSHVGLVVGLEGTTVITVEGNTTKPANEPVVVYGNGVWRKTHDISNHEIIGYGRFMSLMTTASE